MMEHLTVLVKDYLGSGTYGADNAWSVNLDGATGQMGETGAQGTLGTQGAQGVSGQTGKYAETITGDSTTGLSGSGTTAFTVTHSLGTTDVVIASMTQPQGKRW